MIELITISILIALALSVDAFLACFAYSANQRCNNTIMKAPIIIGAFHFILPIITYSFFCNIELIKPIGKIISAAIFLFLGIFCFFDDDKNENKALIGIIGIILLSLSVSIDSLLIGVSLAFETENIFIPAIIFGIITAVISLIALKCGTLLASKIKVKLNIIAGLFFIILGIITFLEYLQ